VGENACYKRRKEGRNNRKKERKKKISNPPPGEGGGGTSYKGKMNPIASRKQKTRRALTRPYGVGGCGLTLGNRCPGRLGLQKRRSGEYWKRQAPLKPWEKSIRNLCRVTDSKQWYGGQDKNLSIKLEERGAKGSEKIGEKNRFHGWCNLVRKRGIGKSVANKQPLKEPRKRGRQGGGGVGLEGQFGGPMKRKRSGKNWLLCKRLGSIWGGGEVSPGL